MENYFPIFMNMQGARVQVFGGGTIAARRVSVLLEFGAKVWVAAPEISEKLEELAQWNLNLAPAGGIAGSRNCHCRNQRQRGE